jgi:hypothetical protein
VKLVPEVGETFAQAERRKGLKLVTERLPGNIPLTRDLLRMLEAGDNVATTDDGVATFQLPLVPLDEQLRRAAG